MHELVQSSSHLADVPDLPGGRQHWSLTGTPFEREHVVEDTSFNATEYFAIATFHDLPTHFDRDVCEVLVLRDPVGAFRLWRDLYRAHASCAIDCPLWMWTQAFVNKYLTGPESAVAYPRLIRLGLHDFFEEIVCRADFFEDAPALAINVIEAIAGSIAYASQLSQKGQKLPDVEDTVNQLVASVCRVTYEHRTCLVSRRPLESSAAGYLHMVRYRVHRLIRAYYESNIPRIRKDDLRTSSTTPSDVEHVLRHPGYKGIRKMTLFLWFHSNGPLADPLLPDHESQPLNGEELLVLANTTTRLLTPENPELEDFIQLDILSEYGAMAFLRRVSVSFRQTPLRDSSFDRLLQIVSLLLLRPEFLCLFASSGLIGSMRDAMINRQRGVDDEMELGLLSLTLEIFCEVATKVSVSDGRAPFIRQYDIVGLFSRALFLSTKFGFPFPSRLRAHIDDYVVFSKVLCERHSKSNALRKALTQSLRYHWYGALQQLRVAQSTWTQPDAALKDHQALERSWLAFGDALGLSEERERVEHEREKKDAARFCAWKECQYHRKQLPSPPSACKGCGEVRYCGRVCQIQDWKAGHKRICNRIKDAGYTSKK